MCRSASVRSRIRADTIFPGTGCMSIRPEHASARINPRHLMEYMNRYRAQGADKMPVAFALGHHPAFEVAAGSNCAWGIDEYEFAGGLMDSPVRVTPSATLGRRFLDPRRCRNHPRRDDRSTKKRNLRSMGGCDALLLAADTRTGVYADGVSHAHRIRSASATGPATTPTEYLGAASYVYSVLKERYPRVLAVNQVCPYTYVIQFKPRVPGESTRLAAMALGSFADRIKNVILVDDDIDPFDLNLVLFSISTRTDADSAQVQIIRDLQANRQDPSTEKYLRVGGLIIDSTKPVGKPFPDIGKPPDDALARIRLEDFVSAAELGKIAG